MMRHDKHVLPWCLPVTGVPTTSTAGISSGRSLNMENSKLI